MMTTARNVAFCILLILGISYGSFVTLEQNCGRLQNPLFSSPWLAKIRTETYSEFFCAGSLINERFVLTAASCIYNQGKLIVRLGEFDGYKKNSNHNYIYEDIKVRGAIIHRSYFQKNHQNNIGLLRLQEDVVYKPHIQPICIEVNAQKKLYQSTFRISHPKIQESEKKRWWLCLYWCSSPNTDESPFGLIGSPNTTITEEIFFQKGILSHNNSDANIYTDVMAFAIDWILPNALEVDIIVSNP
ncbi:venom protease-like [Drosophila elegans]|uniref:venom protease-like n=1 Tax=Drosophila elegans TaxID=30023 RepID=UPI0007E62F00|nr:venom protease-like [Drosophila elegans]